MDAATINLNAVWLYDDNSKSMNIRIPHAEYVYLCRMTQKTEQVKPDTGNYIQLNHGVFRELIAETLVAEWRQAINNK